MSGLYRALVGLHVVTVLATLVVVGVTGGYLVAAWINPGAPTLRRFLDAGPGQGTRLLYPAAAFGLAAAGTSGGRVHLAFPWVWIAGLLWLAAAGTLELLMRPAQSALERDPTAGRAARRGMVAAGAIEVCLVTAALVMTMKP